LLARVKRAIGQQLRIGAVAEGVENESA